MRYKILFLVAFLFLQIDLSSCRMHVVQGTPYKVWSYSGKNHRHWGRKGRMVNRQRYWGRHRSGMRPHKYRGHFREF